MELIPVPASLTVKIIVALVDADDAGGVEVKLMTGKVVSIWKEVEIAEE